jgi:very-short-patch-repair endonuclease
MNESHGDAAADARLTIGLLQNTVPVVLYVLSANELAKWCDRLGLGPSDKEPMASKKSYVRDRLLSTPSSTFPAVAERVLHEFQSHADGNGKEPPTEEWLRAWEALRAAVGVDEIQTIVFASQGKPDLVLHDVPNRQLADVKGAALIWHTSITEKGLTIGDMLRWWRSNRRAEDSLYERFKSCCQNADERAVLDFYYNAKVGRIDENCELPALLPQVWLAFDPLTRQQRLGEAAVDRQRLDFLMYLPGRRKVIIEVDGIYHISKGDGRACLETYSKGLAADRGLMAKGYMIYRFGADEIQKDASDVLGQFFHDILS